MTLFGGDGLGDLLLVSGNATEYKNICLKSHKIFGVNKILSKREFLPLLDITYPTNIIPGEFIALLHGKICFDEILTEISKRTEKTTINEILNEQRYSLRNEKKQPWGTKTRKPFRGCLDKTTITFENRIKLAEKVTDELGAPYEQSKRGTPPTYDLKKITAAILVKGMMSFVTLSSALKEINYIMTVDGSKKYPCSSLLHYTFEKIPKEYLEKAVEKLDGLSVECYSKFDENPDIFVIDNSAITCETL